jgi:hypothetical protein
MNALIWVFPTWFHSALKALTGYVLVKVTEDADVGPSAPALSYHWHKWDDSKDV